MCVCKYKSGIERSCGRLWIECNFQQDCGRWAATDPPGHVLAHLTKSDDVHDYDSRAHSPLKKPVQSHRYMYESWVRLRPCTPPFACCQSVVRHVNQRYTHYHKLCQSAMKQPYSYVVYFFSLVFFFFFSSSSPWFLLIVFFLPYPKDLHFTLHPSF